MALSTNKATGDVVSSRTESSAVCSLMRAELSLPSTSAQKDLFAWISAAKWTESSLSSAAVASEAAVSADEAEEALLLRPGGCRAAATRSTSAGVSASPPFSALMRFFAFLRSRFLSLGVGSGDLMASVVEGVGFVLPLGEKGGSGRLVGSRPWSCWSWLSWRRSWARCLWRWSWAVLLRRQVSQLWAWPGGKGSA